MLISETETFIFKSFGFFEISRDSVNYIREKNLGKDSETILANATPFGIPFENVFKISIINKDNYFSYLKFTPGTDNGKGIVIKLTAEFLEKYPTSFLVDNVEEILEKGQEVNEIQITIKEQKIEEVNPNIPNLDGIIFTLLIGAPLYVLTEQRNILTYFKRFQDLFPLSVSNKATVLKKM